MRLDRFIAEHSPYSRSEVKQLVKHGRIRVNGDKTRSGSIKLSATDTVLCDGQAITASGPCYLMLNKPSGVISATRDDHQQTVIDTCSKTANFVGEPQAFARLRLATLQLVGRLDKDTTGLLLLTDDGQWNHRVSSPRSGCDKTYYVELDSPLDTELIGHFSEGVKLHGEDKLTRPATLEILSSHSARLTIQEGKYHQVKRMFAAHGHLVTRLHRERIGALPLDPSLNAGQFRPLTDNEIKLFTP